MQEIELKDFRRELKTRFNINVKVKSLFIGPVLHYFDMGNEDKEIFSRSVMTTKSYSQHQDFFTFINRYAVFFKNEKCIK